MNNNQAGKGDKPRPVDKKQYDTNYDRIKWGTVTSCLSQQTKKKGKSTYKY